MSKASSRTTQTRETETKEYTYQEPNYLDVPAGVVDRFTNEDMVLRWVRITLKGEDDYKNVGNKMTQGWVFVTPEEVPEMLKTKFPAPEATEPAVSVAVSPKTPDELVLCDA